MDPQIFAFLSLSYKEIFRFMSICILTYMGKLVATLQLLNSAVI